MQYALISAAVPERVTELSDVQMSRLVADGIVEHTAVGVFILIFHLQR